MSISRREMLRLLAAAPLAGTLEWLPEELSAAALHVDALSGAPYEPLFFTPEEWRTVNILVDLIIPADEKSGSATDAKVPEFMDFMLNEASDTRKRTIREGLAWLDAELQRRFGTTFASASAEQRTAVLDDIAYPARAPESLRPAVTFFNSFRDMTAAGFFSSRMGYEDLDYIGNQWKTEWNGCPPAALNKLGVSYDLMEKRA